MPQNDTMLSHSLDKPSQDRDRYDRRGPREGLRGQHGGQVFSLMKGRGRNGWSLGHNLVCQNELGT